MWLRVFLICSQEIPVASDTFDMLLNRPGAVWVNRLPFLYSLIPVRRFKGDLEHKVGLVRRPSGFGQMLFDTTALFAFNHHCESVFRRFFGTSPPLDHHYMILFIDMACVFMRPTESPTCAMKKYMSGVLKDFLRTYAPQLNLSFEEIDRCSPISSLAIFRWALVCSRSFVPTIVLIFVCRSRCTRQDTLSS